MKELISNLSKKAMSLDEALNNYATLKISKKHFMEIIGDDFYWFNKKASAIRNAEKLRAASVKDRCLEVLYIHGESGSGKTTLAKAMADQKGFDYFVSGSGEDFLDGYDKEECIILDDFRGGSMRFSELLKFLDNNTNSSIRSRYYNKDISNCKLIVITSVVPPEKLYSMFEESEGEEVEQFYRRLKHHMLKIEKDGLIAEYKLEADKDAARPTGRTMGNMAGVFEALGIKPNEVDDTSMFEDWYD